MIGEMIYRVTIQQPVLTPDGAGGQVETWQDIAQDAVVAASIVPARSRESFRNRKLEARATHRIFIHYRTDMTPGMRVTEGDDVYEIISAHDRDGKKRCMEIIAARLVL